MARADYDFIINTQKKTICISDLNLGRMSVTNNIEEVVEEIEKLHSVDANEYLIVYRDSEGTIDGWDNKNYNFIGLGSKTFLEALNKLEIYYESEI